MAMAFFPPALHRDNVLRATITRLKFVAIGITGTATGAGEVGRNSRKLLRLLVALI